jgi:multimeric flavodoxin WrbA
MRRQGVRVEAIRAADHDIATGVWPDMTEHGAASDAWPELYEKVLAADILVLAGPIWLGDNSSVTKRVIERVHHPTASLAAPATLRTAAPASGYRVAGSAVRSMAITGRLVPVVSVTVVPGGER